MKIISIIADKQFIRLRLDTPLTSDAEAKVLVFSPICQDELTPLAVLDPDVSGDTVSISRYACGRDGLCFSYALMVDEEIVDGVQYVTDIQESDRAFPYPVVDTKKGLQVVDYKDAKELGVRHSAINVNEGDFLMPAYEEGNTIEFEHDGRVFYFRKSHVEKMDETFVGLTEIGCVISFILLNSPHWRCDIDPAFWDIIKHPAYTGKAEDGTGLISAFNLVTEEGLAYYRAFIAFLTDRYTREDMAHGRVVGMIVGNEVDAGYIWCNSGEMDMETYVREYATALRVTWQTAASIYANMRIFVSIDHFWTASADENQPLRYYKTRDMLVYLNQIATEEGQIPWHIAHHPYPEDLNFPDFWNDKQATPDDDAPIITFKNLEVLARFIYRPEFLLNGERRRIILSEQGFNSHWTPESEILQACAYGRAYRKIMEIPEIDSFILHSHHDNAFEFGLNLGLWRRKKEGPGMEAPKPMYYVFKAIDQKDEKGVYHWERY
ncbi:MAG: hypothetical protein E7661_07145 [Ruminococcaceae bacterium]|nr:hypothetical protein [Oscillospiraceae bacterium]